MLILALETATDHGSCALLCNGQIFSVDCPRGVGAEGQHSATLLPAAQTLLQAQGLGFADLDAIAFDAGPGAFTGLRMGCALAQGLALAHEKPVLALKSLEAMAWQAAQVAHVQQVTCLLDARMGEVYAATYMLTANGPQPQSELGVYAPAQVPIPRDVPCCCGNALLVYPELQTVLPSNTHCLPEVLPHARALAELARLAWTRGEVIDPALAVPLYVRDKVAKTIAERLAEGGRA